MNREKTKKATKYYVVKWQYNNNDFTNCGSYYGFVYIISNLTTGKRYIGKKFFTKAGYKQVKGRRKKIRKDNDWQNYWGSNKTLQADVEKLGEENFKKEILHLCKNKAECGYRELVEIIEHKALERDDFYNDWISIKVTRMHIDSFMKEKS